MDRLFAKCAACNVVFGFEGELAGEGGAQGRGGARRRRERPQAAQPRGLAIEDWGGELRITRRWFSPKFLFLVFFCIFWDGFLVFWYSTAFGFGAGNTPFGLVFIFFPLIHVAVGAGLTYYTICGFVNRTAIAVSSGSLAVRHGPLPWPGGRDLSTADLKQLYCQQRIRRGQRGSTWISYDLNALLSDGKKVKLVSGLDEPEMALFLEAKIEEHLGIEDRPVAGEFQG